MDVQIDIKKLLESLLLSKGKTVVDALKDQGLEWNGKEIVSIEPECIIEEGKWFMCLNNEGVEDEFTTGKVYHALRDNVLINDMREMSFWSNNTKRFRPATPEEIPQESEQKPEWSEKDKKCFNILISLINNPSAEGIFDYHQINKSAFNNWVKSLKDRYTWKPSDEQMLVMEYIKNCFDFSKPSYREIFISVYKQLKAL